jgi:hypothetical protein
MRFSLVCGLILSVLCAGPSTAQRSKRAHDPVENACRERAWTAVPVPDQAITDAGQQAVVARWWIEYMQCLQANMKSVLDSLPRGLPPPAL